MNEILTQVAPNGAAIHPELNGYAHPNGATTARWDSIEPHEVRLLLCVVNSDKAFEAAHTQGIHAAQFKDAWARRFWEVGESLYASGVNLTPDALADECDRRAAAEAMQSEADTWAFAGKIARDELSQIPQKCPLSWSEEAAKIARELTKKPKRARRDEPTPDEIAATAQAVEIEAGNAAIFADLRAGDITAPALLTGDKPEYDPHQIRALLYPSWSCVSLETEKAHAERAAQYMGENIRFCPELGFLHFEASRGQWRSDDKDANLTTAKLAALAPVVRAEAAALLHAAAALASASRDADARAMSRAANSLLLHAKHVERRAFLSGATTFLTADLRAEIAQFAPDAWCFAFANCRAFVKGTVRSTRRDDLFLNVSPVCLDRNADRAEWCALLNRITANDADFARTLQDAAAYAVSGASSLRALLWCYGPRGTGKSTFCELLQTLLGEASAMIDTALLQDNSSRERLGAVLWGKRAAFVAEAGNKRIDAELLKTLSGSDSLSVRFLYREAFTAPPSHCLILAANDAPQTDAYNDALKDRVIALPFVHPLGEGDRLRFNGHIRLESARRDPNSALLRGFAAWVCEGLERLFKTQDIYKAPAVRAATAKFWADTDTLTPFWETVSESELKGGIAKSELRRRYEVWCQSEGARPYNRSQWARACADGRGLSDQKRTGGARFWVL